jgi:uncharacterized protein
MSKTGFDKPARKLEIVLKTVERCNINCSYCYFFHGGDDSYLSHAPYISKETIHSVSAFLKQGIESLGIESILIGFHGGEPMMQKKHHFAAMCDTFLNDLSPLCSIGFSIQTNGTLIDNEWISLFEKYKVGVGVSLDGPKHLNDQHRVDHSGRGSYDRVYHGINKIKDSVLAGKVGLLAVMNPEYDAQEVYKHFAHDLNFQWQNFLFSDYNYENHPPYKIEIMADYLEKLFTSWREDRSSGTRIIYFESIIALLMGQPFSSKYGIGPTCIDAMPLITISSNGDLSPVDELRSAKPGWMNQKNIRDITLKDFFNLDVFQELRSALTVLPNKCSQCMWQKICNGGPIVTRYSLENGFNNPSIYCDALQTLYSLIVTYLIESHHDHKQIYESLVFEGA